MNILEWIVWFILAFFALSWAYGIRSYTKTRGGATHYTLVQTSFLWQLLILFLVSDINKLHILWLAPFSYLATYFILAIPIVGQTTLLVAQLFGYFFTLGLNSEEINTARQRWFESIEKDFQELKNSPREKND